MFRIIVCGGRNFKDKDHIFDVLDNLHEEIGVELIIEGGASGADQLARWWAEKRGVAFQTYEADWSDLNAPGAVPREGLRGWYNVRAGFDRNQRMLNEGKPDRVVTFEGGAGTADMVNKAEAAGIEVLQW